MQKAWAAGILLVLLFGAAGGVVASPGGGGGVEYFTNLGNTPVSKLGLPTNWLVDLPPGSVYGIGGFGYGIDRHGWKTGGFGRAIFANGLSLDLPDGSAAVTGAVGGIGGVISGTQCRIGPIDLSINCRMGLGGIAVTQKNLTAASPYSTLVSGVVLVYGSLEGELGLLVFPATMVSVFAGIDALVPVPYPGSLTALPAPMAGLRITWGRF